RARRIRRVFFVIASCLLAMVIVLALLRPDLPIFREPLRPWLLAVVGLPIPALLHGIWKRQDWVEALRSRLNRTKVEIARDSISVSNSWFTRQLSRSQLLRAEEPSWGAGLYLRTANRYRWAVIPRTLDGYESAKLELAGMGLAIEKTLIPPNWEEFVWVLLFLSTLICTMYLHSVRLLALNFLVSILLSVAGFFIISANPDYKTIPRMRGARVGVLLPVVCAGLGLLLALFG
ncbi:MAG TPA: hypothetical protein VEU52_07220, partial [Candidatus Limnocylindrales bacterium]|nr:hypothetical protein [Candidatus Limnocylindrales bacterium]